MGNSGSALSKELQQQYESHLKENDIKFLTGRQEASPGDEQAWKKLKQIEREEHAKIFDAADVDKSGFLDKKEMTALLRELVHVKKTYAVKAVQECAQRALAAAEGSSHGIAMTDICNNTH